ncbi:DEAD/DEAH box helicase family protein [Tomitella cavernea]|uniref:DEAD/DEAH box helicase family protein n=1 Tax=Tomitella cavernea TaxID=1387982 RepID=A0ABP9CJA3_9ACTN|nr:DEAD/DEAH box helicase family protein [Tomitella cavernea]
MGNFDFLAAPWPAIHEDCARAESYLTTDPRSACIYSRRAAELLVGYLYDLRGLAAPYKDDLAARINQPEFKALTGNGINQKLNLLRKLGNTAVHAETPIPPRAAAHALTELHHVMVWAAFRNTTDPQSVPTGSRFDPALAARSAPLSRAQAAALVAEFRARDEAHAQALAAKDETLAAHEAEIARLRGQIEAAQAAATAADDHDYSEADTRDAFIDVLLREAGWPLTGPDDLEYPVTGMPNGAGVGYVDYVLWGEDGLPLAVVEAKRTRTSPMVGQQQAKLYADCLEDKFGRRPIVFCTNGYEHWLWDDAAGYPPREVQGFYTRDELELLIQRRTTRRLLAEAAVDSAIAGRPYQVRAIKAVGDVFDRKQREALLVMATGAGKTRTVIALVDQLMKAHWAKRVLFLADRTALVNQAVGAFKAHLPAATTVNLLTDKNAEGRVYASTYPTMMGLINDAGESGRRFGVGHFDLVVIDEAHRSVYAKYGAIFDYFDAMLVGLTATPKDEVDHNTYRLFHLEDGVPTDSYGLDEAVRDGWLVPPKGVSVGTKFLRGGIRYDDLSAEERDQWDALDWGEDDPPDEVGAEEINRFLFNEDTVDKVLGTLMADGITVDDGERLGKSIIFAKNQDHADFIARRFDIGWPQYGGHFARVITHATPYAQSLIDDFSVPDKPPHIAISVDMLDTGIDVPEIVNLVFFKAVRSKSKFWQMIGRGTRLRPDLFGPGRDKTHFSVFDFCGNLEYFGQDLPGAEGSLQKSMTQRIYETRLGLVTALDSGPDADVDGRDLRAAAAQWLHEQVAGMTLDNVLVRPHRRAVERFAEPAAWNALTESDAADAATLAGLPSAATHSDPLHKDVDAKRFDLLMLRRQLAQLQGDAATCERVRETVQAIAADLLGRTAIPTVAEQAVLLESVAGDEWWTDVTLAMLETARLRIRGLARFVQRTRRAPVYTDFEDALGEAAAVDLPHITPGTDRERFRAKAVAYLRRHEDNIVLQRLRRNKQLTGDDLDALEAMLRESGSQRADIVWATESSGGLGLFVRSLVGLDRAAAVEAFADYLDDARFNVAQIRFVELIIDELTANGVVEPSRLFESPYTDHAPTGPDDVFTSTDVDGIVSVLGRIRARAEAVGAA